MAEPWGRAGAAPCVAALPGVAGRMAPFAARQSSFRALGCVRPGCGFRVGAIRGSVCNSLTPMQVWAACTRLQQARLRLREKYRPAGSSLPWSATAHHLLFP